MPNGPARAEFWKEFVVARSGYPAPERLRAQLAGAEFSEFCGCGCNSFAVKVAPGVPPLVPPGDHRRAIYEADFKLADARTLTIILHANGKGDLAYIDVDCCVNTYDVPDVIEVEGEPLRTRAAEVLLH